LITNSQLYNHSATGSLVGFAEAQNLGYFKSAVRNLFRKVIAFEYLLEIGSFPSLVESIFQFIIFFVIVGSIIDPSSEKRWNQIGFGFFTVLILAIAINSGLAVSSTWTKLDWGLILRRIFFARDTGSLGAGAGPAVINIFSMRRSICENENSPV
jgi:hypothetical protein